jgi:excisionase family DNA binding protein
MVSTTTTAGAPPELWNIDQVAECLGAKRRFIYRITSERRIRFLKIGGELRFAPEDVAEFIERERSRNDPADPAPRATQPRRSGRPRGR